MNEREASMARHPAGKAIPVEDLPRFRDRFTDEEWAARLAKAKAAVDDEHSHGGTPTLDDGCGK